MNQYRNLANALKQRLSFEEIKDLQLQLMRMSLIVGVHRCKTIDRTALCRQIYKDKGGEIPISEIEDVYHTFILDLVGEQIIVEGMQARVHPNYIERVEEFI